MDSSKLKPTKVSQEENSEKLGGRMDVYQGLTSSGKAKVDGLLRERDRIIDFLASKEKEIDSTLKRLNSEKNQESRRQRFYFDPED